MYVLLASLAFFAPKIYQYYRRTLKKLYRKHPHLRHIFRGSLYPAISLNFGPATVTVPHKDTGNIAGGMCVVQSGGNYDPKIGGHLYLTQLKVVVEFPPGATMAIPSATVEHGNVGIREGETRTSVTQYMAGGLFRWVDYGYRTWKVLLAKCPARAEKISSEGAKRWREAVERFSKVGELHFDRMSVFHPSKA